MPNLINTMQNLECQSILKSTLLYLRKVTTTVYKDGILALTLVLFNIVHYHLSTVSTERICDLFYLSII